MDVVTVSAHRADTQRALLYHGNRYPVPQLPRYDIRKHGTFRFAIARASGIAPHTAHTVTDSHSTYR